MKIAFLTPEFPHPKTGVSGGIGTSIKNLAKGLVDAGHQVSVLVYGQDSDEVFHQDGVDFYRIKNVKLKGLSWYLTRKKIEFLIDKLYREKKIDLVEAPDWTGITSFIQPKCPVVIRLNGSDTYFCHLDNRIVRWENKFHERRALKKADALVSVSAFTAEVTKKLFKLKRDFTIIPNSIDAQAFAVRGRIKPNTILYFGTLIRKKGLLELPLIFNEVIRDNPDARLILVGRDSPDVVSGNDSTWDLMAPLFSREALQHVDYVGSVPYNEIADLISSAAVCVFPTFAEALPVSWIEAMAMEKAVVASNIGWATEVIREGESGFLSDPKDHKEFARKINLLLRNPHLAAETGQRARERVLSTFDIGVVARKNIEFYTQILNNATQRI